MYYNHHHPPVLPTNSLQICPSAHVCIRLYVHPSHLQTSSILHHPIFNLKTVMHDSMNTFTKRFIIYILYMYVYMYVYIYMYICMYVCIYICIYIYIMLFMLFYNLSIYYYFYCSFIFKYLFSIFIYCLFHFFIHFILTRYVMYKVLDQIV